MVNLSLINVRSHRYANAKIKFFNNVLKYLIDIILFDVDLIFEFNERFHVFTKIVKMELFNCCTRHLNYLQRKLSDFYLT